MSTFRGSFKDELGSLFRELEMLQNLANSQAPGDTNFKNEILRLKFDTERLMSTVSDMEISQRLQRSGTPQIQIDWIAQSIQNVRNGVLYLKRHMNVYKQWYQESPSSERHNYSSTESMTPGSAPRQMRFGENKALVSTNPMVHNSAGGGAFSFSVPRLQNSQHSQSSQTSQPGLSQEKPQSVMSTSTQSSSNQADFFCNTTYHQGNNYMNKCILCYFKRYNPARLWELTPPPHYAHPARSFM